jgi:phage recombination protein Bet
MNLTIKPESAALAAISEAELMGVLSSSLYPGAAPESIKLVLGYCKAAGLDPMQKPVHIVPMWDSKAGRMRDVIMPGVGLYRTQAARTGRFAGQTEPEFGPMICEVLGGQEVNYPEWARVTVKKQMDNGAIAEFTAKEYWIENYAVRGGKDKSIAPNAMWSKRPRGQIGKCAAAQALRLAFPEMGAQPTADEMEGKELRADEALPTLTHDYMDPALVLAGVADCETDAEAAAYWKAHNPAFLKQPGDHAALKAAVVAHRKHLAAELAARTVEMEPEAATTESAAVEGNPF